MSDYAQGRGSSRFDDEEITSEFALGSEDPLPPLPSAFPSARSLENFNSLVNFDTTEAFRKLYSHSNPPETSIQIAASSQRSDHSLIDQLASYASQHSDSLEIELGAGTDSHTSQDAQAEPAIAEENYSDIHSERADTAKADNILWHTQKPLVSLRNFSLRHGQDLLFSDVNFDIAQTGLHIVVCEERPCRRLLMSAILGGIRSGQTHVSGQIDWHLRKPAQHPPPKLLQISASELLMTVEKYLLQATGEDVEQQREILSQLSLDSLLARRQIYVHDLEPHERRAISLLLGFLSQQEILCMDDPLDGLSPKGSTLLVRMLQHISSRRAVLLAVPALGPLADIPSKVGWHEGEQLLPQPKTAETVLESDPAYSPNAIPKLRSTPSAEENVAEKEPAPSHPSQSRGAASSPLGPRGFRWLVEGKLAGTPEPGLLFDIEYDLSLLRAAGITMLVTLTEQPLPDALLEAHGLKTLFFPIVDMNVPSCRATEDLCALVELAMDRGEVIAFHCKAGLGRTGTLLVSYLIWEGAPPQEALEVARSIEPGWVQSDVQEQYLFEFARYCESRRPSNAPN